jgi:hypothetical protein
VLEAWRRGARFDAWTEEFRWDAWQAAATALGVDLDAAAAVQPGTSQVESGVVEEFLAEEARRAADGVATPDCRTAGCTGCGVCGNGVEMDLLSPTGVGESR